MSELIKTKALYAKMQEHYAITPTTTSLWPS